ncbi:MAG: winged helix-turn-helix domain-containing protein [Solirubrobacterales bacterium]|nr:winged helix-turn-helix domain-containing protein [Solirubrobacterales bacterium]
MDVDTPPPKSAVYRFDCFTLDLVRGALLAAGGTEVALRPKAFSLLRQLVENAGRLIDRDEIMAAVWPGVTVTDDSVTQAIKEIRRALGDGEQRLLRTVPRRGFLFAAEVSRLDDRATLVVLPPAPDQAPAVQGPASRPMLVVLPFANMTGDPGQEYFADGITEDLTTALSHLRWFSVIARNSAFTYKGRAVDVRQVGRELGVGYVLEGSVRKAGNRVRITAQLCEADAGAQVWAGRFDGDLADIFDLQDRLTEAVVGAIEPSLRLAEVERIRSRPTESLTAYDLYLRALPHRFVTQEGNDEALRLLRRAIAIDPGFTAAKGALAGLYIIRFGQGWAEEGEAEEAVRLAREVVDSASEDAPSALAWAGHALAFFAKDYDSGTAAVERALLLAPNSALVLRVAGWLRVYVGDAPAAIVHLERAMRLSPVDPAKFYAITVLGYACFSLRRYAEAAELGRRALSDRPTFLPAHRLLLASLAQLGDRAATEEALRALLAIAPGYTVAAAKARTGMRDPTLFEALRKAGLPD